MVKLKIREKIIFYAVEKKRKMTRKNEDTEQMIARLQKEIEDPLTPEEEKTDLESKLEDGKRELGKIVEYNTQGAILRAKVRWYNEGEKNTSYFLGLEKRHCRQGTITQLKTGDTEMFINTDKEILNLGERFYKDLYSSKLKTDSSVGIDTFLSCEDSAPLNPEEQKSCEGRPTKPECLEALKSMASGKSPGTDGLPAEVL